MAFTPGPGMGGGWGPPGVYTQRHGFKPGTKEYAQSKAKYHALRYGYAGRSPFDVMKLGYWKQDAASRSPRHWNHMQKLANYVFWAIPGRAGKAKVMKSARMVINSPQGKALKKIAGSSKTQKQLESAMGLKKALDKRIVRTNPMRRTQAYKNGNMVRKSSMDALYVTLVYGVARAAWTGGGSAVTSKILNRGRHVRRRRYS